MNSILLIGAIIAIAGAMLTTILIRQRDFVGAQAGEQPGLDAVAVAG
jgi:hypothetical protein